MRSGSGRVAPKGRKVILIGLDGLIPEQVLRYRESVPDLGRLMDESFFSPAHPSLPTDTPTNWTTIATGAWAGTHGIAGFRVHLPGTEAGESTPTLNSHLCKAEYFWQAAERQGKRSILVNFPTGWPVSLKNGVVIGGDGLQSGTWTVRWPELISSHRDVPGVTRVEMHPNPAGWEHVPAEHRLIAEGSVDLDVQGRFGWGAAGVTDEGQTEEQAPDRRYLLAIQVDGIYRLVLSRDRDLSRPLATLTPGEWSGWVEETYENTPCLRRYKLIDLSEDGTKISLYGSMACAVSGWAYPGGLEAEIIRHAGAYVEGLELEPDNAFRRGWFDRKSFGDIADIMRLQADWTASCAEYLARTEPWDIMFVQYHAPDGINHDLLGDLEDADESIRSNADRWLEETHAILFGMVERIRRSCACDETLTCVVSDHGNMPVRTWVNGTRIALGEGWTEYVRDEAAGTWRMDPRRSKAWLSSGQSGIWINLENREKYGCVAASEYEDLRNSIINRMRCVVDPDSGKPAFALVGRREDFQGLGVWGDRFPDVLCIAQPYFLFFGAQLADVSDETMESYRTGPEVTAIAGSGLAPGLQTLSAIHWAMPTAEVGYASVRGTVILNGPGVSRNTASSRVNLVDVAPTLAHFLGIDPPSDAEGRVMREAFEPTT